MQKLLHFPHSSLKVPGSFYEGLTIDRSLFRRYNLEMSDVGVDELFRDVEGERIAPPFPDVCIGVEDAFFDGEILDRIIDGVSGAGYTYAINYPYRGSLVPNAVLSGEIRGKVVSVMIEVNKRLYL